MAIEAAGGVLSRAQTVFNQQPQAASKESSAQEAQETRAVTEQEANKGDVVAQRKLARENAAKGADQPVAAAPAVEAVLSQPVPDTGAAVDVNA